ncbi:MAG: DNA repair protein RecN [Lachnospiraceae bacterium]|nr:DNA repair protein RecN [Lachnospiraceae bacterium]
MLSNVHVKNFALIDEADIVLDNNLNILTGETGAGKSILLGAVNLALGSRTNKDVIRQNADYCLSELTFTHLNEAVLSVASQMGIDCDDDEIVVSRKLLSSGKSVIRINSETVTASAARRVTSELIDIYGQHEHISLLDESKHLEIIDRFLGSDVEKIKKELRSKYDIYSGLKAELDSLENDPARRAREIDRLNSEIEEIESAKLIPGEEERLKEERRVLMNSGQIREALSLTCTLIEEDDGCSDRISAAIKALGHVCEYTEELSGFLDDISDIDQRLTDVNRSMKSYLDGITDSEEELENISNRLDLIYRLKNKYGNTYEQIENYLEQIKEELVKNEDYERYAAGLTLKTEEAEEEVEKLSKELSGLRQKASRSLQKDIEQALSDLGFNQTRFEISITARSGLHADGIDNAAFMISLNPGEELKALSKIASGGEMSRIMLAIISVFANRETIDTFIFDEIDSGISGIAASKVADKLAGISKDRQVICITHLPQIAAMADTHFKVEKNVDEDVTLVHIHKLSEDGINDELSRIMGGDESAGSIKKAAKDIKTSSDTRKKKLRKN